MSPAARSSANSSGTGTGAPPELPDELSIRGLQPVRPASSQWKQLAAGAFMVLSMVAVLGMIVWKRFGPQEAPAATPIAVASDQLPPLRFDAPREAGSIASAAPVASAAGTSEAQVQPTASASTQPIPLQRPGTGPIATPVVPSIADHRVPAPSAAPTALPATYANGNAPAQRRDDSPFVSGWPAAGSNTSAAGLQRTSHAGQNSGSPLGTAAANLEQYQTQLDGMVRQLQTLTDQAQGSTAPVAPAPLPTAPAPVTAPAQSRSPALFGQLERTATPRAHATMLGARSYVIPKGVLFQCALKTRVVSAVSGFVGCQVQRSVYSDDGKVVLIERGSHLDGEYRIVQVRPGVTRIPILWTRVRTPHGVTVDLDSPATGALGDSGITGEVNNRWMERIGAALLLSLIDDAIKLQISENTSNPNATVVLPNTAATTSRLAEKVLDSTINIPPLITAHQGSVVGVYVSRDLDFSGVYRLEAR